jgi:hypothetical protein
MILGIKKLAAAGVTSLCLVFNPASLDANSAPEPATFSYEHIGQKNNLKNIFNNARGSLHKNMNGVRASDALQKYQSAIDSKSACLGYATDQILEFADDNNLPEPDVAANLVRNLHGQELERLPMKTKINLIKSLTQQGAPTGKTLNALIRVYAYTNEDPAFVKWDAIKQAELANILKDDQRVIDAKSKWNHLSKQEKVNILQYISDLAIATYGKDYNMDTVRLGDGDLGKGTYGQYSSFWNYIEINLEHRDLKYSFEKSVATTLHESMHAFHDHLDDLAWKKQISSNDPAYIFSKLILRSFSNSGYVQSSTNFGGYLANPTERHANEVGKIARYAGQGKNIRVPSYIKDQGIDYKRTFDQVRQGALRQALINNENCFKHFSP